MLLMLLIVVVVASTFLTDTLFPITAPLTGVTHSGLAGDCIR